MSAATSRLASSEAVIYTTKQLPFRVVPTPAPKRGFFMVTALCAFLVLGSLFASFAVNTAMVKTAYDIRQIQKASIEAHATEATLEDEILQLSSPEGLASRAEELGLARAYSVRHVDLEQGTILETANAQGD